MSTGHEGAHQRDADRAGSSRKKYVHDVVLTRGTRTRCRRPRQSLRWMV